MKKVDRIQKKLEFDLIIKKAKAKKNNFFVIHYQQKREKNSRFGIAVGTKLGGAVIRNKLKRRVREIIREERILFKNDLDYIIILRKPCLNLEYWQMKENLINLIKLIK